MAENYNLSLTAEEIDERLANAVLCTEQTLSEEQKAQARANIGAAGGAGLQEITLTTAVTSDMDEGAWLTEEESCLVAAAMAAKKPVIITFPLDGRANCAVFNIMYVDEMPVFFMVRHDATVVIASSNGIDYFIGMSRA